MDFPSQSCWHKSCSTADDDDMVVCSVDDESNRAYDPFRDIVSGERREQRSLLGDGKKRQVGRT